MALTLSSQLQEIYTYGSVATIFTTHKKKIPQTLWDQFDPEVTPNAPFLVDQSAWIGIEVEVERLSTTPTGVNLVELPGLYLWDTKTDNSLKDNGKEFVTIPIKGPAIPLAIEHLHKFLNTHNKGHLFSSRCGTHIHVGCRYMTVEQLVRFLLLYLVVENVFFDQAGEKRKHNNFCVPLGDSFVALEVPELFFALENKHYADVIKIITSRWKKYAAINTLPLVEQGTIEFRHYGGASDPKFLLRQINMILALRKFAIKNSTETVTQFIKDLNTTSGYNHFVDCVLGLNWTYTPEYLQSLMEGRVRQAKELLYYVPFLKRTAKNYAKSPLLEHCGIKVAGEESPFEKDVNQLKITMDDEEHTNLEILSVLTDAVNASGKAMPKEFSLL